MAFSELVSLKGLTFPAVWRIIAERYTSTVRAFAARTADETAGLALAVPGPDGQFELLSLYVVPLLRRLGHGRALLQAVERHFRAEGFRLGAHFFTMAEDDKGSGLFLLAAGWSRPEVIRLLCRSTVTQALETPWLAAASLPPRYRIVAWQAVTPVQRQDLQATASDWIRADIDPFLAEPGCDAETSIALIDSGTDSVCGWVIAHRLDDTVLRWTCSYLEPTLQGSALMRALWLAVVRRQSRFASLTDFTFTVPVTEPRMARFVLRRMQPWLSGLSYACRSVKSPL